MKIVFVSAILLISLFYSIFIFSGPDRIDFWVLIMWAPALVAMSLNYLKNRSLRKVFEPIAREVTFKTVAFAIIYPVVFLGVLAFLLATFGLVVICDVQIPSLSPVQLALAPVSNFLLMYGEEYGWRGFLLEELWRIYGKIKSTIVVGTVWATFHFPVVYGLASHYKIDNPLVFSSIQMVAVFVLSFPFAHVYFLSRSIIGPMILHLLWNIINPFLFGNLYLNKPGVFKGEMSLTNGEGIAGIVLGSLFIIWFFRRYRKE